MAVSTSRVEGESYFSIDNESFNDELGKIVTSIIPSFDKTVKSKTRFHFSFFIAILAELIFISMNFSLLVDASVLAFAGACLFLTIFAYFILRIYFQAQKAEKLEEFIVRYSRGCDMIIKYREGIPEHHIALANAYTKLSLELIGREQYMIRLPKWMAALTPTLEQFCTFCFLEDVFLMREALLKKAIEEHVKLVKCEPTSLDIHAALANAYVTLSSLYLELKNRKATDSEMNMLPGISEDALEEKFRATAEKAIEEFKILNDYAPNDPWVHAQLAYSYRDLQMPQEEIEEYEIILKLRPDDTETLFKLGSLYFDQGRNADGLRIYEKLKQANFKKAENLIASYGKHELAL